MKPQVLIVDDAPEIRRLFRGVLNPHYTIHEAASGERALDVAWRVVPDVILLGLEMPGLDGYDTCRRLKRRPELRSIRVIVFSVHSNADSLQMAFDAGADDFLVKPVDPCELLSRVQLHVRLRQSLQAATNLQLQQWHGDVLAQAALERSQEILAGTLLRLVENRDNETGQHLVRMRDYAVLLAKQLQRGSEYADQIDAAFIADLYRACPLHDIGKVGIPDELLRKPGRLTPEEFEMVKEHTSIGANILEHAVSQMNGRGFLVMATDIARFHHERWDGKGYPSGLAGDQIPLSARIVAVADVFDALTSQRCYKQAWTPAHARRTIQLGAGTQFDAVIVAAFQRSFGEFVATHNKTAETGYAPHDRRSSDRRQLALAV